MKGGAYCLLALAMLIAACSAFTVTKVRLVNGPILGSGRVEIQVDGVDVWGTICAKGFDWHEATVICRMLGFTNNPGVIDKAITSGIYGPGDFNYLMNNVTCAGSETTLSECPKNKIIDCVREEDHEAAVECQGLGGTDAATFKSPNLPAMIVPIVSPGSSSHRIHSNVSNCEVPGPPSMARIYGRSDTPGMGYLQAQDPLTGIWGFVCDDKWSVEGAKVACREMCYSEVICPRPGILPGYLPELQNPNIILDDLNCTGTETNIRFCQHSSFGGNNNDCLLRGREIAGIQCTAIDEDIEQFGDPSLDCTDEEFRVIYSMPNAPQFSNLQVHVVNEPECREAVRTVYNNRLILTIPLTACGTRLTENITHLIYANQVEVKWISTNGHTFDRYKNHQYKIMCAADRIKKVTNRFQPFTLAPTINITNNTEFELKLRFYVNEECDELITANPFYVEVGKILYAAIDLITFDDRLKLVTTDCTANPVGDPGFKASQNLIVDKCPMSHYLQSTTLYPLNATRQGLRFRAFKFIGYSLVYLHCEVVICRTSQVTRMCDRTCQNEKPISRRKRQIEEVGDEERVTIISPPMIVVGDDKEAAKDSKILTGDDTGAPAEELPFPDDTFSNSERSPSYVLSDKLKAANKIQSSITGSGYYVTGSMTLVCGVLLLHLF